MTDDLDYSWSRIGPEMFLALLAAQDAAAATGLAYVPAVLEQLDQSVPPLAPVNGRRFSGGMRDGRPIETALHGAVWTTKAKIKQGFDVAGALLTARDYLNDVTHDAITAANRGAVAAGITVRPELGYVRMLNPPSCKFCITLAGKYFRWNEGFQAHPSCDCRHVPSRENVSGDLRTDPYAYFHGLDTRDQDRLFGKQDAQALRDGGDIYRIVNTRSRGLADDALKNTPGRNRGWQSRRWDSPSKMTIDDIYRSARTRDEAIALMGDNGFITGEQTAGGNLKGNSGYGYAGQLGRGGARKGATLAYKKAVATGKRDLLEPATQTAAERRLHSAVLGMRAVRENRNPYGTSELTPTLRAFATREYEREIDKLSRPGTPDSVKALARLLGLQ